MKDIVYKNIIENQLIYKGDKILVGVSGGCDSVFLLNILNALKTEIGFEIIIVHINHLYRGKSAFDDEEFVKDQAEKLGLKFILFQRADKQDSSSVVAHPACRAPHGQGLP